MMISCGRVLAHGVERRRERVGVADLADRPDVLAADHLEREVDAHLGGVEHGVVVDHEARVRAVLGNAQDEADVRVGALAHCVEQLAPAQRLIGDDEDRLRRIGTPDRAHVWLSWLGGVTAWPAATGLASVGGLKMPCTAPGTPYS